MLHLVVVKYTYQNSRFNPILDQIYAPYRVMYLHCSTDFTDLLFWPLNCNLKEVTRSSNILGHVHSWKGFTVLFYTPRSNCKLFTFFDCKFYESYLPPFIVTACIYVWIFVSPVEPSKARTGHFFMNKRSLFLSFYGLTQSELTDLYHFRSDLVGSTIGFLDPSSNQLLGCNDVHRQLDHDRNPLQ